MNKNKFSKGWLAVILAISVLALAFTACVSDETAKVDKSALQSAIISAEAVKSASDYDDYTQVTKAAFESALTAAKTVNDHASATQDEVDAAKSTLTAAQGSLEKEEAPIAADKTALADKIAEAEAFLEAEGYEIDYDEAAREAFEAALADAIVVNDDDEATQDEVDAAVTALDDAITALMGGEETNEVDKTELAALITTAQAITLAEGYETDYDEAARDAFEAALADAIAVNDNDEATQDEVDTAIESLGLAIDSLVEA